MDMNDPTPRHDTADFPLEDRKSELILTIFQDCSMAKRILNELPRDALRNLCLVCTLIYARSRPVLYDTVVLNNPRTAFSGCVTLADGPQLAEFVRVLRLDVPPNSSVEFWEQVAFALQNMPSLKILRVSDVAIADNTQQRDSYASVLTQLPSSTRLTELAWSSVWDDSADEWLAHQSELRALSIYDSAPGYAAASMIPAGPTMLWPNLQYAELSTPLAICVLRSSPPLRTLKIYIDTLAEQEVLFHTILPQLQGSKTLRALNIWSIRNFEMSATALDFIATALPDMYYVGILPLPALDRSSFHASLMRFHSLSMLEVDATHMKPGPGLPAQIALAWEMSTFCPSLHTFAIWVAHNGMRQHSLFEYDRLRETWALIDEPRRIVGWEGQVHSAEAMKYL